MPEAPSTAKGPDRPAVGHGAQEFASPAARPPGASLSYALVAGVGAAAVAVFCYSTARLAPHLPEAYWAPIASLVVLFPDREATKKAAMQQLIGTTIGSLIGWAGATLWHHHVLVYGLAVFMAVATCCLLGLEPVSRLCAVAITVITIIPRAEPAYWAAFHRFIEVSYGVTCALAYMMLVDQIRRRRQRQPAS